MTNQMERQKLEDYNADKEMPDEILQGFVQNTEGGEVVNGIAEGGLNPESLAAALGKR